VIAPLDPQNPATRQPKPRRHVQQIVVLGGGFGGIYTAHRLEKIFRKHEGVDITLISRDNYFLMPPLLFEAGSGVLEPRHAVNPIRPMFHKTRFIEADIEHIDFDLKKIFARHSPGNQFYEIDYDHVVIALGGVTNRNLIPGAEHAFGFKTLGDAIFVRNHIIDLFEQADAEEDPDRRRKLLTIVVIGGGLVGTELLGELTEFVHNLLRSYPRIPRELVRFVLIEGHDRIMPEMEPQLAEFSANILWQRGASLLTGLRVQKIEPGKVFLPPHPGLAGETMIESATILLAAGIGPNPLLAGFPLEKDRKGRLIVDATMRSRQRPDVWALGDCACIPDPNGNPYPPLAQHALREAKVLANNIAAIVKHGDNTPAGQPKLEPFIYETMGMLASLGHYSGVGRIGSIRIKGFLAWWVWRTYYMMQMTRWDRRFRVILDWTIALLFRNDVVKLDLFGEQHPSKMSPPPGPPSHPLGRILEPATEKQSP
jgi:NADH dehydrogenase